MADPDTLFDRAGSTLSEVGWSGLLQRGFGTIFLAWVFSTANLFGQFMESLFAPVRALFGGFATFLSGTIGGAMRVIDAGATASVQSFLSGIGSYSGPFAFVLAVIVVVLALLVVEWWWNQSSATPWGYLVNWRR